MVRNIKPSLFQERKLRLVGEGWFGVMHLARKRIPAYFSFNLEPDERLGGSASSMMSPIVPKVNEKIEYRKH